MAGYWTIVPKGTWKITDSMDSLDALSDGESRASYDYKTNRINVLGPDGKAIIIDLKTIIANLDGKSRESFLKSISNLLGVMITIS